MVKRTPITIPFALIQDAAMLARARTLFERLSAFLVEHFESTPPTEHPRHDEAAHVLALYAQLAALRLCLDEIKAQLRVLVGEQADQAAHHAIVALLHERIREAGQ